MDLPEGHTREVLTILSEECAEVIHRVSKALRFGLDDIQMGQPLSNRERIAQEVGDFIAVLDIALDSDLFPMEIVMQSRKDKVAKMAQYMVYKKESLV